jgi:aminoglycoside phosphotransferase family enzyme/predicted kinase
LTGPDLLQAMIRPDFYPHKPTSVELVQTHISHVFIAGELVYKVKKAVNFGFLDFTTLEKRKYYCGEELRLNKRLAPSIYLDIIPISINEQNKIILGLSKNIIDYAVLMKKLPMDRMLKILLNKGEADQNVMDAIAEKIAAFHQVAETGGPINEIGGIDTISHNHDENFAQTQKYINITIPAYQYNFVKDYVNKFLTEKKDLFEKRVANHKIRDCHGDLHLEHICITDEIIIFDCIEFNERFRFSDVAAEVAFLTMDLDYNGYPQYDDFFVKSYFKYSADTDMLILLNFYRCYYAYVRGKVISFRLDQKDIPHDERSQIKKTAERYFDLAYTYAANLENPVLILTAGLMGCGKSYQARHLAARLNAKTIRTDVLRKEMLNINPTDRYVENFGQGIYSDNISRMTYDKAYELAEAEIKSGKAVIIDASFKRRSERQKARQLAARLDIPFYIIECTCTDKVVKMRLEKRVKEKDNASDGRWEIYVLQKNDFDEINEVPPDQYFKVDTSDNPELLRHEIIRKIKPRIRNKKCYNT